MSNLTLMFKTEDHLIGLILRVTLAIVIFPHGCQLLFGWFGGYGFSGTMEYLTGVVRLPWVISCLVILLQFFGAIFILLGFSARLMAFGMLVLFAGMIVTSHLDHGFFMNWYGTQKGEGYEYHLLVIGLALALFTSGSGSFSLDRWMMK